MHFFFGWHSVFPKENLQFFHIITSSETLYGPRADHCPLFPWLGRLPKGSGRGTGKSTMEWLQMSRCIGYLKLRGFAANSVSTERFPPQATKKKTGTNAVVAPLYSITLTVEHVRYQSSFAFFQPPACS